jgi:hypothetical protein
MDVARRVDHSAQFHRLCYVCIARHAARTWIMCNSLVSRTPHRGLDHRLKCCVGAHGKTYAPLLGRPQKLSEATLFDGI